MLKKGRSLAGNALTYGAYAFEYAFIAVCHIHESGIEILVVVLRRLSIKKFYPRTICVFFGDVIQRPKKYKVRMSEDGQAKPFQRDLQIPFPPKPPINCVYTTKIAGDLARMDAALVFTHGAGGTLQSDAMANFTHGFSSHSQQSSILCFQGNMNLKSRVKMFSEVIASKSNVHTPRCLGGRSMGARAAVMAATENTTHLVLFSYPLHTAKETRDQVLLDLPASIKVIFVTGGRDDMCNLERLEEVRSKMNCKTWRIVVENADHGMNVTPKAGTREVGRKTGNIVAMWLKSQDVNLREGKIAWNTDQVQWSGWSLGDEERQVDAPTIPSSGISAKGISSGKRKRGSDDGNDSKEPKSRLSTRKKRTV